MNFKRTKKYILSATPLFISLLLASCVPNNQAESKEAGNTTPTGALPDTQETLTPKIQDKDQEVIVQDQLKPLETSMEESSALDSTVSLANPMEPVDSEKDFNAISLSLALPETEAWCSNRSYTIIDGKVAQIAFYDEITKSDAQARAGNEEYGDPSGIYYNFDEKKEKIWSVSMADGTQVDITVSVTVDNSDIHGVLASWTYQGVRYSLWEDNARDQADDVGKLAVDIAKRSE